MMKRRHKQRQTYTRGLPDGTRILYESKNNYNPFRYYPEYATGLFNTGWEPYYGTRSGFATYQEAKDFLENTEQEGLEMRGLIEYLHDPKSAVKFVKGE